MNRTGLIKLEAGSLVFLRYALVIMLILGGISKWTKPEAVGIQPWMSQSPFLSFLYRFLSIQGASIVIGVVELATAVLIATRHWLPRVSMIGSALAIPMFVITLSFLVTTPNQGSSDQGFLMKDAFLLGIAVWSFAEAGLAAKARAAASSSALGPQVIAP